MNDEMQSEQKSGEQPENLLALDLGIGDALQVQDPAAPERRYYVKLIGFLNKASIIVSHPIQDEKPLAVKEGQGLQVRGFSGRQAYEFKANVLSVSDFPYPHMHLSFPAQIECQTMRSALRIQPKLAGWIEPADFATTLIKIPAVVVDLSTSGARVTTSRLIGKTGDVVKVGFRLPIDDEEHVFSIPAVIRKSYNETPADVPGGAEVITHGLEFIQPVGHVRMALQSFIYKTMAEG